VSDNPPQRVLAEAIDFAGYKPQFSRPVGRVTPLGEAFFHKTGEALQCICLGFAVLFLPRSDRDSAVCRIVCHGRRSASHLDPAFRLADQWRPGQCTKTRSLHRTLRILLSNLKDVAAHVTKRSGYNGAFTVLQTVDTVTLARSARVSANDWSASMEIVHSLCIVTDRSSTPILISKILKINLIRRQETRFKKRISDHPVKTFTGHGEMR
jgi:hypothetical protein